jgi:hypothetical protein
VLTVVSQELNCSNGALIRSIPGHDDEIIAVSCSEVVRDSLRGVDD